MDPFPIGRYSVSRVGFGAMQLPGPGVMGPPRDRDAALAVLRRAVELGVNHIDTAQFYGPKVANQLIREALHPYPENLALVSKVGGRRDEAGAWLPVDDPADLRRDLEANLSTLGVERLAAVNLRVMESAAPDSKFDDQLSVLIQARDEGLIDGIGLSEVTKDHLLHALDRTEIVCVQNSFNLVHREAAALLTECTARGIAFVPFFPLGSAFAGPNNPVLGNKVIQQAAAQFNRTPAQIALAWTLSVAPNVLLIAGTSSVQHLEENLAVTDIELDEDTRAQLDDAAA